VSRASSTWAVANRNAGETVSGRTNLRGGDGGGRGSRTRRGGGARWRWWREDEEAGLAMAGAGGGGTPRGLRLRLLASLLVAGSKARALLKF